MENPMVKRIEKMLPNLNEKEARRYLALEAKSIGRGGISEISRLTGVSRKTIELGCKELNDGTDQNTERIRKKGGGRKPIVETQGNIEIELEKLVDGTTIGSPENPLKWTTKSLRNLAAALVEKGFKVGHTTVGKILTSLGYSLQVNKKCLQVGKAHPDRNEQFEYINEQARLFLEEGEPVISVDAKKKELIGNFKNNGAEYCLKGHPMEVLDHDFMLKELGKVNPYGIYDLNKNCGFINLGTSHDTSEFAIESIYRWWTNMGIGLYPNATKLYITCDGGGSNGSRTKLWKTELQHLADKTGLEIHVSHFPPGTSKWNKIEHKMFCFISKNWRGKPLISIETTINLITSTTTKQGLKIGCSLDENLYQKGIKVSDEQLSQVNISRNNFHGDWNYSIAPLES